MIFLIVGLIVSGFFIPETINYFNRKQNVDGYHSEMCFDNNSFQSIEFPYQKFNSSVKAEFILESPSNCFNPSFPNVKFIAPELVNAWIQVIESDSDNEELRWFVDKDPAGKLYYNKSNIMYDSPNWGIGFYYRHATFFHARSYPVQRVSASHINIFPAVEWGFEKKRLHFSITGIKPRKSTDIVKMNSDIEKLKLLNPELTLNFVVE